MLLKTSILKGKSLNDCISIILHFSCHKIFHGFPKAFKSFVNDMINVTYHNPQFAYKKV
jgi:hypothetical protein